jgi:ferredoxin
VATITVLPDEVEVPARAGECILAALYRNGFGYRTGCRRGGCGICKVDLVKGEVDYPVALASAVFTLAEQRSGTCLSCRAVPAGDVTIRLRDQRLRRLSPLLTAIATHAPKEGKN